MTTYESYTTQLSDRSRQKAWDELHEKTEENRAQLKQFVTWIQQHQKWLKAPTDPLFLMSFLRVRKFSQLLARESLVNFFISRQKEASFFRNVDIEDSKIVSIFKSGFTVPLPQPDKHGRQVFICRPGLLDLTGSTYHVTDMFKASFLLFDQYLREEEAQVNGFILLIDLTGITRQFGAFLGEHKGKFLKLLSKAYPVRLKGLLIYNAGPVIDIALTLLKSVVREKMQKRIETVQNMTEIYEKLGQNCLPLEYLPDDYSGHHGGTCSAILETVLSNLRQPQSRKWTEMLSSDKYSVKEDVMPPREELFTQAFRKLQIH